MIDASQPASPPTNGAIATALPDEHAPGQHEAAAPPSSSPTGDSQPTPTPVQAPALTPLRAPDDGGAWPEAGQSFRAALLMAVPAIPFVGLVSTIAVYAAAKGSPLFQLDPVATGAGVALLAWLVMAAAQYWLIRGTSAEQVNTTAFNELRHRLGDIIARFAVAQPTDDSGRIAARQLQDCITQIRTELQRSGPAWIMGSGYISAWKLVHRAEEALLLLEPASDVIAAGLYDELRLTGAQIDNSDQLLSKLRLAVSRLDSDASSFLAARPTGVGVDGTGTTSTPSGDVAVLARVALREVRQTVNAFRDDGWDGIVRTRNHLIATLTATGLATYLGLVLAITLNPQPRGEAIASNAVLAAGGLFLVGAMVGLFNRLNTESNAQNDIEDYGLTMARLILTPVLAGIAAVGGVFVAAMAASGVTAAALSTGGVPSLGTIFNLSGNPFALALAAVFGLSPGMLIDGLRDQAEKYKAALKSTNPQGH